MLKTKIIEPGQCFVKRHDYNRTSYSQFYGYVENNDPVYYDKSLKFVDRYGPYLVHLTSAIQLKLLILPYPSAEQDTYGNSRAQYIENFKTTHKFNAISFFRICIEMYDTKKIINFNNVITLIDQYIQHLETQNEFLPDKNLLIKFGDNDVKLYHLFTNITEFFFEDRTLFLSKDSYTPSIDSIISTLKNDKYLLFHVNVDYVIANWLTSMNLDFDGWIRQVTSKEKKDSQEILLFPNSVNKLVINDGCNCKLINSTCTKNTRTYDKKLSYERPKEKVNRDDLRILSYNIHFWSSYNMGQKSPIVYGVIKNILTIKPDIISIQEDDGTLEFTAVNKSSYNDEYHHMLLELNTNYEKINGCKYDNKFYNTIYIKNTIKSRYNIEIIDSTENNIQSEEWFDARCVTILLFNNPLDQNDKFIYANTHINSEIERGPENFNNLITLIDKHSNNDEIPVIITGDFNAYHKNDYNNEQKEKLCASKKIVWDIDDGKCDDIYFIDKYIGNGKKYKDMFHSLKEKQLIDEVPIDTTIYGGRIDFLIGNNSFYNKYQITNGQVIKEWSSDHTPIFVDIRYTNDKKQGGSYEVYVNNKKIYNAIKNSSRVQNI